MTPLERKKKQYQLDALRARKAKADALGAEVIARTKDTYDRICGDIQALEQELAADTCDPIHKLTAFMLEIPSWTWSRDDYLTDCKKHRPEIIKAIDSIGKRLTDAYNANRIPEFKQLLQQYREAWKALNRFANEPPQQQNFLEGFTVIHDAKDPWTK